MCFALLSSAFSQVFTAKKETVMFADQKATLQYNKGVEAYNLKQYDNAVEHFSKALEFQPSYYNALFNRAIVYFEMDKNALSANDLLALKERIPNGSIFHMLGRNYLELNQLQEALDSFKEAARYNASEPLNFYYQGNIFYQQEKYKTAIEKFDKAIEIDNQLGIVFNDRGMVYRLIGEEDKAMADFIMATQLQPNLDYAYNNLGDIRMEKELFKEAETDFTVAVKINPENHIAYNNRGMARMELGDYEYALDDFNKAESLVPGLKEVKSNIGYVMYLKGEYLEALNIFNQLITNYPEVGAYYFNRAIVKEVMRDEPGACDDWNKALELGIEKASDYLETCK